MKKINDYQLGKIKGGTPDFQKVVDGHTFTNKVYHKDVKVGYYYYVLDKINPNYWYFVYVDKIWNDGIFIDRTKFNFTIFRTNNPSRTTAWTSVNHNFITFYSSCL